MTWRSSIPDWARKSRPSPGSTRPMRTGLGRCLFLKSTQGSIVCARTRGSQAWCGASGWRREYSNRENQLLSLVLEGKGEAMIAADDGQFIAFRPAFENCLLVGAVHSKKSILRMKTA